MSFMLHLAIKQFILLIEEWERESQFNLIAPNPDYTFANFVEWLRRKYGN